MCITQNFHYSDECIVKPHIRQIKQVLSYVTPLIIGIMCCFNDIFSDILQAEYTIE